MERAGYFCLGTCDMGVFGMAILGGCSGALLSLARVDGCRRGGRRRRCAAVSIGCSLRTRAAWLPARPALPAARCRRRAGAVPIRYELTFPAYPLYTTKFHYVPPRLHFYIISWPDSSLRIYNSTYVPRENKDISSFIQFFWNIVTTYWAFISYVFAMVAHWKWNWRRKSISNNPWS